MSAFGSEDETRDTFDCSQQATVPMNALLLCRRGAIGETLGAIGSERTVFTLVARFVPDYRS